MRVRRGQLRDPGDELSASIAYVGHISALSYPGVTLIATRRAAADLERSRHVTSCAALEPD